jgi:GNAT superfamily N-acetyltransferase
LAAHLGWDTEQTWSTVEEARVTWGLPGLLAVDGSRVDGWTFYTRDGDVLQLGGLVSESGEATAQLLREVLKAAEHAALPTVSCFVLERAEDLRTELTRQGFEVEPFLYLADCALSRRIILKGSSGVWHPHVVAGWRRGMAGELLCASYSLRAARYFAPHGTAAEWQQYVATMIEQTACGVFDPFITQVVRDKRGMRALAFITRIGPRTAHLAQFAVHPEERSRGLASRLLQDTMQLAALAGCDEMTLLVGEANQPARHLYERRASPPAPHSWPLGDRRSSSFTLPDSHFLRSCSGSVQPFGVRTFTVPSAVLVLSNPEQPNPELRTEPPNLNTNRDSEQRRTNDVLHLRPSSNILVPQLGCSSMKRRMSAMQSASCNSVTSTPCDRRKSMFPGKFWSSPTTTRLTPNCRMVPEHIMQG